MRRSIIYLFPLLLLLAACNAAPGGMLLIPQPSVTPASAPVPIPGATSNSPAADASAGTEDGQIEQAYPNPTPPRTPVRIKVPPNPPPPPAAIDETTATPPSQPPTPTAAEPPAVATVALIEPSPTANPATVAVVEPTPTAEDRPLGIDHTLNILVLGSDERVEGQPWRSDVIMVVAVDFARKEVGVISFPRDLWVKIPTVGENRINTATFFGELYDYKSGGVGLLEETLAQNFGIRIDNYVKIDFKSFQDVIDALGGIDVKVDCPISGRFPREPGSKELVWQTLEPGEYHMDGLFALRYVRERKSTSDVDRARRQQRVLIAVRNRAREINVITRLPALYDALRGAIETDLGFTDIITLARLGLQVDPDKAHGFVIGFKETDSWTTPQGAAVLLPRMDAIQNGILHIWDKPTILKSPQKPRNCR
ncbi:MAG: hypothetical protein GXP42_11030 [Chloroflexi bacterium]|nr:hypothetical protein [Chloroflexota bacterium]